MSASQLLAPENPMKTWNRTMIALAGLATALSIAWPAYGQDLAPGSWHGQWANNRADVSGDLTIQIVEVGADLAKGRVRQTRPSNATWKCTEDFVDVDIRRNGPQLSFSYAPGGRCSPVTFTFTLQDGKLAGTYRATSGAEGSYVLSRRP